MGAMCQPELVICFGSPVPPTFVAIPFWNGVVAVTGWVIVSQ